MQPLRRSVYTRLSSQLHSQSRSGTHSTYVFHRLAQNNLAVYSGLAQCRGHRKSHTASGQKSQGTLDESNPSETQPAIRASDKLFADALEEEKHETASRSMSRVQQLANQKQYDYANWTGDEDMKDAVLRMLVDKYKPLRYGEIQTAEERMKKQGTLPDVGARAGVDESTAASIITGSTASPDAWKPPLEPTTGSWADEPLLPSKASHNPWDTTYSVPWHQEAAIKTGNNQLTKPKLTEADGAKQKRKDREAMRRQVTAGRLTSAREATLDYKLGIKRGPDEQGAGSARPNPTSIKQWGGYVEDRIEKARKAGLFNNVKGRGRPLARTTEEHNPFIAREEFLMNRIVQRNGAVPAWVDLQNQLDDAIKTFRGIIRESWTRRAARTIASTNSSATLATLTLADVKTFRDPGWFEKEKKYLEAAIKDVNDTVRRYNGVAPYIVRRGILTLESEVNKAYEECGEDILKAIQKEPDVLASGVRGVGNNDGGSSGGQGNDGPVEPISFGIGSFVRSLMQRIVAAVTGRP